MRPLRHVRVRVPVRAYLTREQYAEAPVAARPACNFQQPRVFLQHVEQDLILEHACIWAPSSFVFVHFQNASEGLQYCFPDVYEPPLCLDLLI